MPRRSRTSWRWSTTAPTARSFGAPSPSTRPTANRLAAGLASLGARSGDTIVWCGQNSIGVVTVVNAARKLGVTAVPLNYRLAPEEAAYVIHHSDASLVYVDAEYATLFEQIRAEIPQVDHVVVFDGDVPAGMIDAADLVADQPSDPLPDPASGEAGATMIYTSGTTGKPKGALRRGAVDAAAVGALLQLIGYQPDDVYLTTGPLYHSGPGGFMAIAQALGNTVVAAAQVRARRLAAAGRHLPGDDDLLGTHAHPHGVLAPRRGESPLRPLEP